LSMTTRSRPNPLGPLVDKVVPMELTPEGYTPCRFSGRQIALRFDQLQDVDWSLGKIRLDVVGGSKR
jgi:hypothetical protein